MSLCYLLLSSFEGPDDPDIWDEDTVLTVDDWTSASEDKIQINWSIFEQMFWDNWIEKQGEDFISPSYISE